MLYVDVYMLYVTFLYVVLVTFMYEYMRLCLCLCVFICVYMFICLYVCIFACQSTAYLVVGISVIRFIAIDPAGHLKSLGEPLRVHNVKRQIIFKVRRCNLTP